MTPIDHTPMYDGSPAVIPGPDMSGLPIEIDTPAGTFASFTESAAAGYPVFCAWFARCDHPADVALPHPVLGAVPTCNRCAAKVAAL